MVPLCLSYLTYTLESTWQAIFWSNLANTQKHRSAAKRTWSLLWVWFLLSLWSQAYAGLSSCTSPSKPLRGLVHKAILEQALLIPSETLFDQYHISLSCSLLCNVHSKTMFFHAPTKSKPHFQKQLPPSLFSRCFLIGSWTVTIFYIYWESHNLILIQKMFHITKCCD